MLFVMSDISVPVAQFSYLRNYVPPVYFFCSGFHRFTPLFRFQMDVFDGSDFMDSSDATLNTVVENTKRINLNDTVGSEELSSIVNHEGQCQFYPLVERP